MFFVCVWFFDYKFFFVLQIFFMKDKVFVFVVLLFCFWVLLSLGWLRLLQSDDKGNELKNYISWEDLRVVEEVGRERRSFSVKVKDNNMVN